MIFLISDEIESTDIQSLIQETQQCSVEYYLAYLVFSLSNKKTSWEELPLAYKESIASLNYYFYLSHKPYISYSDIKSIKMVSMKTLAPHFDRLHEYLKLGDENKTFEQLQKIYHQLSEHMNANPHVVQQLFYDFLVMALNFLQESNKDSGITDYTKNITLRKLQNLTTLDAIYEYMLLQLNHYFSHIESIYLQSNSRTVERVKEFCRQNNATNCSLDDIANSVYLSKNF